MRQTEQACNYFKIDYIPITPEEIQEQGGVITVVKNSGIYADEVTNEYIQSEIDYGFITQDDTGLTFWMDGRL